jgi:hypothetical protein
MMMVLLCGSDTDDGSDGAAVWRSPGSLGAPPSQYKHPRAVAPVMPWSVESLELYCYYFEVIHGGGWWWWRMVVVDDGG